MSTLAQDPRTYRWTRHILGDGPSFHGYLADALAAGDGRNGAR